MSHVVLAYFLSLLLLFFGGDIDVLFSVFVLSIGDVWINNGSGGTDICGVIVASNHTLPIYVGELQSPALGMSVQAWDDNGKSVQNEQGNMVITRPFPNVRSLDTFRSRLILADSFILHKLDAAWIP